MSQGVITLWPGVVSADRQLCYAALSLNPLHQQWQKFHCVCLVKDRALWNPWTSSGSTAASLILRMKPVSVLTQTAGVKFTRHLKNSQPHLAIVSPLSLHNGANKLNPPWNALSRTCQHVRERSVLRSVLIQPIERWQLSVSQTFTRPLWLQVLSSSSYAGRAESSNTHIPPHSRSKSLRRRRNRYIPCVNISEKMMLGTEKAQSSWGLSWEKNRGQLWLLCCTASI